MTISKTRKAFYHFFDTTKKGYDHFYWIFVIIAGGSVITKLFGFEGAAASILAFVLFYLFGRVIERKERRTERERREERKHNAENAN